MEAAEEMESVTTADAEAQPTAGVQSAGFLLELSPDWLIIRASENAHSFLGEYHQRLVGDPLANFTLAQPLHDLRNSLARQRGSSGIARAYRIRLIDEPRYFDIAFQSLGETIILEGLESRDEGLGDALGSVSRLIDGLNSGDRKSMLDGAARRMRALTGYDRVTLVIGDDRIESSRGQISELKISGDLPPIVADTSSTAAGRCAGTAARRWRRRYCVRRIRSSWMSFVQQAFQPRSAFPSSATRKISAISSARIAQGARPHSSCMQPLNSSPRFSECCFPTDTGASASECGLTRWLVFTNRK